MQLTVTGRASVIERAGKRFWVATERLHLIGDVLPTVRGWMESLGPITAASLAGTLAFPLDEIEAALLKLESEGQVMRGRFTPDLAEARNRMVQPARAGADSSPDAGAASPRN